MQQRPLPVRSGLGKFSAMVEQIRPLSKFIFQTISIPLISICPTIAYGSHNIAASSFIFVRKYSLVCYEWLKKDKNTVGLVFLSVYYPLECVFIQKIWDLNIFLWALKSP